MNRLHLARLFKKKETAHVLDNIASMCPNDFSIVDINETCVYGPDRNYSDTNPFFVDGELCGWVKSDGKVDQLQGLIEYLLSREYEKKSLAAETLNLYKEINLLYNLSDKIKANFNISEIANCIIDEATRNIRSTHANVMLSNEKINSLEIIAAIGESACKRKIYPVGKGIAGHIFQSGKPEIVNNTCDDIRYLKDSCMPGSLLCAPVKTREQTIGVINLSHDQVINYTAADLKLFCTLVSQGAIALENALLHASTIREEKIKSHLERYVSEKVVNAIMNAGDEPLFSPEKRRISILFSDIRGFTRVCESVDSNSIVANLNTYFENMVDVIFTEQGTINKFVGDMIVALFGAPENLDGNERHTVSAAIGMQNWLKQTDNTWISENFQTGIGINTGEVIVGNIGAPKHMDYTAIGDEVNLAARLQSLASAGQILVSQSIYTATSQFFDYRYQGAFPVKGKEKPVDIYEVIY